MNDYLTEAVYGYRDTIRVMQPPEIDTTTVIEQQVDRYNESYKDDDRLNNYWINK